MAVRKGANERARATARKVAKSRAKKTGTSRRKTAVKKKVTPEGGGGREFFGWFLFVFSFTCLISLVSDYASLGTGSLLGPYLGTWLASVLRRVAGSLPVLVLLVSTSMFAISILRKGGTPGYGKTFTAFLLFVELALLLSLRNIGVPLKTVEHFTRSGGIVGNFLVDSLFVPVFGQAVFGPYLLVCTALFFTLVLGTPFRPLVLMGRLQPLLPLLASAGSALGRATHWILKRVKPLPRAVTVPAEKKSPFRVVPHKRGKVRGPVPLDFDKVRGSMEALPDTGVQAVLPSELSEADQTLVEGDVERLDPRSLRKLRDEQAEIRRMAEVNNWEDKKPEALKIDGLLHKQADRQNRSIGEDLSSEQCPEGIASDNTCVDHDTFDGENGRSDLSKDDSGKENMEQPLAVPDEETLMEEPEVHYDPYRIPDFMELLPETPKQKASFSEEQLVETSRQLEQQLEHFRIKGKVTGICTGPVITRFEIDLAPGVKVSKISGLADDLALAMRAKSVRILAPIPGKSAVGIEMPNPEAQIVYVRDIMESEVFAPDSFGIQVVLGKNIAGEPYTMDLAKAPHLLIAGQTGSGKSVCINAIMASLLGSKTPDELRMILVDPKVVELKPYEKIPHLLHPVVTQPEQAVAALKWACIEMDRRYEVLALAGVRNIVGFNTKFQMGELAGRVEEEDNCHMHYLVIMIDELADLMMVAGKEVETSIARIAQKARAVGIHLVLATQRPSTNVITGTIKANLPTRISFKVASHIDARTILDRAGAEKLLGRGDMLFQDIAEPEPIRVHGAFLTDDEAEILAAACSDQNVHYPQLDSFDPDGEEGEGGAENVSRDDKFNESAELVVATGSASTSMLQRRLGVGYARAGRIIDQLERTGVIGKARGSKAREVLMDETTLMSFLSGDVDRIIVD